MLCDNVGFYEASLETTMFEDMERYFGLPEHHPAKSFYRSKESEHGYSRVPGEKMMLTCRSPERVPLMLRKQVMELWTTMSETLHALLNKIAPELAYLLTPKTMEYCPSLIRLFRYEASSGIVSEPHRDLGLLSLVVSRSAGLEVWQDGWKPMKCCILTGQTLRALTGQTSGLHRVMGQDHYRYSIVFALRANGILRHGEYSGRPASVLFERIRRSHYNVNTVKEEREKQKNQINSLNTTK